MPERAVITTDALVIGAGPVGLFQVFQLGLLELKAQLVDALPELGGQCAELYPDKPIYDIPGLPVATGRALVSRLAEQARPFQPGLHLGQLVAELQPTADGRFLVTTDQGTRFDAGCVLLAAGAGAFLPRLPSALVGLDAHLGHQALHHLPADPAWATGRQIVVLGDETPALAEAIALAECPPGPTAPAAVTLVHRREHFRTDDHTLARFNALRDAGRLQFVAGQPTALLGEDGQPAAPGQARQLAVLAAEGPPRQLPLDTLLLRLGLSPRLGPIAHWGLALARRQVQVDTARFETNVPGLYAVGDINTYPGKRKLLLCGFHEATLAAYAAAERLRGAPVLLQYTTTSPRLHALLGVDGGATAAVEPAGQADAATPPPG